MVETGDPDSIERIVVYCTELSETWTKFLINFGSWNKMREMLQFFQSEDGNTEKACISFLEKATTNWNEECDMLQGLFARPAG